LSRDGRAELTGELGLNAGSAVDAGVGVAFGVNIAVGSGVCTGVAVGLPHPTAKDAIIERQTHSQASLPDLMAACLHRGINELQTYYRLRQHIHYKVAIMFIAFYITL
jgi:hypothetical protein